MPDTTSDTTSDTNLPLPGFRDLDLPAALLSALDEVGYETPTPIQTQAIPYLLEGSDLLGRAPSGTGKTAAFALPLLSRLDIEQQQVQVMVLAPTRELAIQVAEAFRRYAAHLQGFHVLPIYGGQDYTRQIQQLKRGVHVVVGTPGRVMDHMRRGTLQLDALRALVLDEADEMLRMGFIDDVQWILDQTPAQRQMALFSATIPKEIQRIARRYLRDPKEIAIASRTATAETIHQRYWLVGGLHKLDALTRILEVEPFDALIMFVRTKTAT
ncbi:MAG: DEAD/DEAH box helicase, partial [Gammaproteobacteria bacterium]|nr:DEAD/DEAH box helicase [Gammaproteobacteria bacterium]